MTFGLSFDPAKLEFEGVSGINNTPDVMAGYDSPEGMNRTVNATRGCR